MTEPVEKKKMPTFSELMYNPKRAIAHDEVAAAIERAKQQGAQRHQIVDVLHDLIRLHITPEDEGADSLLVWIRQLTEYNDQISGTLEIVEALAGRRTLSS